MTTDTFRRADHRPVPTSADEAEASPVALRAPSEAPASCCFPLDIAHSPSRRRLSKEIVGRERWPDYRQREKIAVANQTTGYDAYVGEYEISGIRVTLSRAGDELFVLAPPVWPQRLKLYPSGDNRFFLVDEDVDLSFVRGPGGHVIEMRAVASGQNVVAKRVK
jgi:hypothetical protein